MKHFLLCGLLCVAFGSETIAYDDALSLTGVDGNEIVGSVEPGRKPGTVNLKRSDNRVFHNVPLSSFSAESKKIIAASFAEAEKKAANLDITSESRLDISFQRQKSDNNNKYGDIDDRVITIQPRVVLDSNERENVYKDISGEVVVVGIEAVSKDRWVILDRQKFKFPSISPDEKVDWEGKVFECRYDPDYAGYKFEAYLVVLRNKEGQVVMKKGTSTRWEEIGGRLLKARKGTGYTEDFAQTLSLRSKFGLPD